LLQEPTFNERAGNPNYQRGAFIPRIKCSKVKSRRGSPVATRFWHRKGPPNPKLNHNSAAGDMRTRVRQVMGITLNAKRLNHVHRGLPPVSTLPHNCKPAGGPFRNWRICGPSPPLDKRSSPSSLNRRTGECETS